jgi:hypothetical protein
MATIQYSPAPQPRQNYTIQSGDGTTPVSGTGGTTPAGNAAGTVPTAGSPPTKPVDNFSLGTEKPMAPPVRRSAGDAPGAAADELVQKVEAFLANGSGSVEDAQLLLDALNTRMLELTTKLEGSNMKARQGEIDANAKKREEQIKTEQEKAKKIEEKGFWSKLWGVVKAVASVIGAAAMVVAGAALTAVSGPAGAIVAGLGVYMLVGAGGELVKEIIVAAGGERPTWSLTLGYAAAQIAKAAGASEETQMKWQLGVDIAVTAVAIGVSMLVPGMQARALAKISEVTDKIQKMTQIAKIANAISAGSNLVGGVAMVGQGINTIETAQLTFDQQTARLELSRLQALYDQLMQFMQQSSDRLKNLQETTISIFDNSAQTLDTSKKAQMAIWRPQTV